MQMVVPERSHNQRMAALAIANIVRVNRSKLKADLRTGQFDLARLIDFIEQPPDWVMTMKVQDLLKAIPTIGKVKAGRIMRVIRVAPSKTLEGLSDRQRRELVSTLTKSVVLRNALERLQGNVRQTAQLAA